MAKRRTTRTKTAQLKCANLLDFRGFCRVLLYRVSAGIALITRMSRGANGTAKTSDQSAQLKK
jgi:hypothetical protein